MAVVVILLLAVVSVVLAVVLVRTRTSLERTTEDLASQTALVRRLESEAERLTDEVAELTAQGADQRSRIERLVVERESLIDAANDHAREIETRTDLVEQLTERAEQLKHRVDELETEASELRARSPRSDLALSSARDAGGDGGVGSEALLWELELARSARTWRYSVSTDPLAIDPFTDAQSPLTLALEVEAAALREDVGARLVVNVDGDPADAGTALVVLRATQELLVNAAREAEQASVEVTVRGRVAEIVIDARDEDDRPATVTLPPTGGRVSVVDDKLVITADE